MLCFIKEGTGNYFQQAYSWYGAVVDPEKAGAQYLFSILFWLFYGRAKRAEFFWKNARF